MYRRPSFRLGVSQGDGMADRFVKGSNAGYWRLCRWLTIGGLLVWLVITLVPLALAQFGATGTVFGWPLAFAIAAFGVPLVYLTVIGIFNLTMDRVERNLANDRASETDE